jgi:hypothetical protein
MYLIPALRRLRLEDPEFEANLSYIVRSRPAWATGQDPVSKKQT